MAFGIEGERIRLVPGDADRHADNCFRWLNDPQVTEFLSMGYWPLTRAEERAYFEKPISGPDDIVWGIETLDGRHIGQCGLHLIDFFHGTAKTGTFIGDPEMRGQGYGSEAVALRCQHAFLTLNLRMLYSEYFAGNNASQRMQERNGYETWGIKPAAQWKNGEFRDLVQTYLPRERWLRLQEP